MSRLAVRCRLRLISRRSISQRRHLDHGRVEPPLGIAQLRLAAERGKQLVLRRHALGGEAGAAEGDRSADYLRRLLQIGSVRNVAGGRRLGRLLESRRDAPPVDAAIEHDGELQDDVELRLQDRVALSFRLAWDRLLEQDLIALEDVLHIDGVRTRGPAAQLAVGGDLAGQPLAEADLDAEAGADRRAGRVDGLLPRHRDGVAQGGYRAVERYRERARRTGGADRAQLDLYVPAPVVDVAVIVGHGAGGGAERAPAGAANA